MYNWLAVFIGGGLGSLLRYAIGSFVQSQFKTVFPIATFISNLLSCLFFAATLVYFSEKLAQQALYKMFLLVGFCGGFSTFSAFSYETAELIKNGNWMVAVANILLSFTICFFIFYSVIKNL